MGLAERKLVQAAKDTDFKSFSENVKAICGFDVKLSFDWAAVENHADCQWICANKKYNDYFFDRVTTVLTTICGDDMGKTAVREKLKEINMIPAAGDLDFTNGVFTIRNDLVGNGAYDAEQIQNVLEKGL